MHKAGRSAKFAHLLVVVLLLGCVSGAGAQSAQQCLLPQQSQVIVATLYFGRDVKGRGPVSDREWSAFVVHSIAPVFPDGFTVQDGAGEWRNPKTGQVVRERAKVLTVAAPDSAGLAGKLRSIADAYRRDFHQMSVGIVTSRACAAF